MYAKARSQRVFFSKANKIENKMARGGNLKKKTVKTSPKGYLKILKLHGMFLVRAGLVKEEFIKSHLNIK